MGKASKGSRKGKKAWRANIKTDDIEEFFEQQTRDAHAGAAAIPSLPSDSLFFVDKPAASASTSTAGAITKDIPVKRKIEKKREKVLYHESVLERNPFVQPVPSSVVSKKKAKKKADDSPVSSSVVIKKDKKKAKKKVLQEIHEEKTVPMDDDCAEKNLDVSSGEEKTVLMDDDSAEKNLDVSGGDDKGDSKARKDNDSAENNLDIWGGDGKEDIKVKKRSTKMMSVIPAVEVEPPGCSFNPPLAAHQDSLAQAVADEMRKIYTKELGPKPVPLIVPGEAITEEDKFFLDADDGDEDVEEGEGDQDADVLAGQRKNKTKRVTRVEMNRRARRKERLKAEEEAKKKESLSKEIDSLPNIIDEIAKEDEEKEKRRIRRNVTKEERLQSGPPRLGKHKFEPAPVQVLLTEEISGSLRKLRGCCNLARDRYKSIEKRGILAPSKRISKRR